MDLLRPVFDFMTRIEKDPRVRVTHIALFMVLYERWVAMDGAGPVMFLGRDLMAAAKISSTVTYHRAIRALHEYGYIRYEPSFSKKTGCKAYLQ